MEGERNWFIMINLNMMGWENFFIILNLKLNFFSKINHVRVFNVI